MKWSFEAGEGEESQPDFRGSNGRTTNSVYAQNEIRKSAMEERAVRWLPTRSAMDTAKFLAAGRKDDSEE